MQSELIVQSLGNTEIPSYEATAQITTCENRFEIILKPGQKPNSWDNWLLQGKLAMWLESRIDSKKDGGHNPENSTL